MFFCSLSGLEEILRSQKRAQVLSLKRWISTEVGRHDCAENDYVEFVETKCALSSSYGIIIWLLVRRAQPKKGPFLKCMDMSFFCCFGRRERQITMELASRSRYRAPLFKFPTLPSLTLLQIDLTTKPCRIDVCNTNMRDHDFGKNLKNEQQSNFPYVFSNNSCNRHTA